MANDIPTTPAGRQFAAWFSAFNSADYSEIDKLHIPFEKVPFQTDGILMFRHQTGGFDLIKIEERFTASPGVARVESRHDPEHGRRRDEGL